MATFRAEVELQGDVFNGAKRNEALRKAYKKHLLASGLLFQGAVEPNTPFGVTGALRRAWKTQMEGDSSVVVSNSMEYGIIVEEGRQPGKGIPIEPLELWVKRVIGLTEEADITSMAINISRKAKARGIPGKFFVADTFDAVRPKLDAELGKIGGLIVRELER
ncbi:MAG: HK97 gp10 family phage protein [Candidatus Eremiobacteraeota bacterium]|nr:HK97 gp10 family phage protein [Candidatus Eremiobacteraeota bacterium]